MKCDSKYRFYRPGYRATGKDWTSELDTNLKSVFHLNELRPLQRETINATLAKEDCLLIMPTGGGKSLCYQLPAVLTKGLTLVICPLMSLIEDQHMALERLKIPSAMYTYTTSRAEANRIQIDMVNPNGQIKILLIAPHLLVKSCRFLGCLKKSYFIGHLARIVLDEVHLCSKNSHDFNHDYQVLNILKSKFPKVPILGLTATASVKVVEEVKVRLNIPKALLFRDSFNRPNVFYEVQEKPATHKETMDKIIQMIEQRFKGQSGIIYCYNRKDCEDVAANLLINGIKAGCYHALMTAPARSLMHRKWLSGDIQVIVATVAFGMGIDKPDVRFVIHHSISKSIQNFYQESGRAGRDGQRSDCIVLYSFADVTRQSSMVYTEKNGLSNLYGIVQYCLDIEKCRRALIAPHFGEVWESAPHCNRMCDHCASTQFQVKFKDVTKLIKNFLSTLGAAQKVTPAKLLDAWNGADPACVKGKSELLPSLAKNQAERVLAQLLVEGYLKEEFHFTGDNTPICYIIPGPKAKLLYNDDTKVKIQTCDQTHKMIVDGDSETYALNDIELDFEDEDEGESNQKRRKVSSQSRKIFPIGEVNPSKRGHADEDEVAVKKPRNSSSLDGEDDLNGSKQSHADEDKSLSVSSSDDEKNLKVSIEKKSLKM